MKILISPDSFKGTLSALEVCDIIGKAFTDIDANNEVIKLPVADGGEGLCACISKVIPGRFVKTHVNGVFGENTEAEYYITSDNTAVIEMASCAGLPLAGNRKNPEQTTTFGVGQLILDAIRNGVSSILLGLGGSATNDCGMGMAMALGYRFLDCEGNDLPGIGSSLLKVQKILKPDSLPNIPIIAACDVENPLFGRNGAAFVFAPQKGADEEMVLRLDEGLKNICSVINKDLGVDVSEIKGAGAAGGMGAGTIAFLNGSLKKGIDIILDKTHFDSYAKEADLIITGEGRLDGQSVQGKVISGVAARASDLEKKTIAICGCKGEGYEKAFDIGISKMYFSCTEEKPISEILKTCKEDLYKAAVTAAIEKE